MLAAVALVELVTAGFLPAVADHVDLFVLLAVLNGLKADSLRGLAGGLAAGLVQDTITVSAYGLHGLACCVVGYGSARLAQRILVDQRAVTLLLIGIGALVHQAIVIGLLAMLDIARFHPGPAILLRALATAAVGAAALWTVDRWRIWRDARAKRRTLETGR